MGLEGEDAHGLDPFAVLDDGNRLGFFKSKRDINKGHVSSAATDD